VGCRAGSRASARWYPTAAGRPASAGVGPAAARAVSPRVGDGAGAGRGGAPKPGTAHRNDAPAVTVVGRAVTGRGGTAADRRGSRRTTGPPGPNVTDTLPSTSVRKTRAPAAARRSIVERVGWPYGLSAPAEAIATRGRTAARNASVVAVRDP
jgi:hypothetical protein